MRTSPSPELRSVLQIGALATLLKLLLHPAVHSTDLDVHVHWTALTTSLPLRHWYHDESSVWTLDYPPLFAYFQRSLAAVASLLHPPLTQLGAKLTPEAVFFMRASVVATDALLVPAVYMYVSAAAEIAGPESLHLIPHAAALILCSPGLILVDNVHFQYNGLVLAVLLFAISCLMRGHVCLGAASFSAALNLKHTLLPAVPAVAAFLLQSVHEHSSSRRAQIVLLVRLAVSVISVFTTVWLPLYVAGGYAAIRACLFRLFPFGRGLLHAYWAPNVWALAAVFDRLAAAVGLSVRLPDVDTASGHIGAAAPFSLVPNPTPAITACLVALALLPVLAITFADMARFSVARRNKSKKSAMLLPHAVAFSSLCAFLFGWHVHEKMILLATVPFGGVVLFLGNQSPRFAFALLSTAGHYSLFPLITSPAESAYKLLHFGAFALFAIPLLVSEGPRWQQHTVHAYLVGCACVEAYAGVGRGHFALFGRNRLEFLPLLLISAYSAVGVTVAFATLVHWYVLLSRRQFDKESTLCLKQKMQ
jgi:alpha-1,3-glucosyltransferase